jgi:zinc transport system permease protein
VFLSAALSQAAGLGVTLSFFITSMVGYASPAWSPTPVATVLTVLAALGVMGGRTQRGSRRDSILGLIFLLGSAGTLALGTRIVQQIQDIQTILFGSAVAVMPDQYQMVAVMTGILLVLHLWWMSGFIESSFDREGARVRGLPVRVLDLVLLLSIAVSISVCTRVLGALPVFVFSVLPALAAVRVSANVQRALAWAAFFGAASGLGGYLLAFYYRLPVGASQTLFAAGFVGITELWGTISDAIRRSLAQQRRASAGSPGLRA